MTKEERDSAQLLVDFAQKFFLTQVVDKPTGGKHILDLLWTNNPEEIAPVQVCDIPGFSDHRLVKTSVQQHYIYDVKKLNLCNLKQVQTNFPCYFLDTIFSTEM